MQVRRRGWKDTGSPTSVGARCSIAALALCIAISISAGCSRDTAVGPPGEQTPPAIAHVGDTVSGVLKSTGSRQRYYFQRSKAVDLVLLASATGGAVQIAVSDSSTARHVLDWPFADGSPLATTVSPLIYSDTGTYELDVTSRGPSTVNYRVHIHALEADGPPEHAAAATSIGTVVDGEALDNVVDVDDYSFDVVTGDEFIVYAQGRAPDDTNRLVVDVTLPGDTISTSRIIAAGNDPDSESHASGRIIAPRAGTVHLRVAPYGDLITSARYVGAYRLEVARIDRAPERQPQIISLGDTINGESIDRVGDVDEFFLDAQQGEEYNVFFQTAPGPASNALRLEVSGLPPGLVPSLTSTGTDTLVLAEHPTSTFRIPASGRYVIRVAGIDDREGLNRGAYRLFVYRIDRHPEHVPAVHALGDTVVGERLELPGDIDEYSLTVPAATLF